MPQPSGLFITGTDTSVGKTTITATLAAWMKSRGTNVGVMKPVETGVGHDDAPLSDAEFLIAAAGVDDPLDLVCPYRLQTPASPLQAGWREGRSFNLNLIMEKFRILANRREFLLVEGVGGLLAPIAEDFFPADLAGRMGLPLLIVARLSLGTINHTLLTVEAAKRRGLRVHGVLFNLKETTAPSVLQKEKADIVRFFSGVPLLGFFPHIPNLSPHTLTPDVLRNVAQQMDFNAVTGWKG
jgi:dethiobiotin synthetase